MPVVLTVTKTGTETQNIVSNDTILVSVDELKEAGIETITFDFDFSNGSWGGGAVGYNAIAEDGSPTWTQTDWSNGGTESITVNVADLWVNEEDPTDAQNIQVQVWWNAGEELPVVLTITKVGDFNVVDSETEETPSDDSLEETIDDVTSVATPDNADTDDTTEQPETGDNGIVVFALIAVIAFAGVVFTKKSRA